MISRKQTLLWCVLCSAAAWSCEKSTAVEKVRPAGASTGNSNTDGGKPAAVAGANAGAGRPTNRLDRGGSDTGGANGDGDGGNDPAGDAGNDPGIGGNKPTGGSPAQGGITGFPTGGTGATGGSAATGGTGGTSGGPLAPPKFSKRNLLESLADCATASYGEFASLAETLSAATATAATDPSEANAAEAREAWRIAMASWQRAEPWSFGPAASTMSLGGRDLRDQIYIFPLANSCLVDQTLVNQGYAGAKISTLLSSARGLSSLEYLLFHTDGSNACHAATSINANGAWAALGADELRARRAAYAKSVAGDVLARAKSLVFAWAPAPNGDDFYGAFTKAGSGSAVFSGTQDAFNAASDGLFYVEQELKDWKLGWPLGLVAECVNAPSSCPNDVESRYARVSTDHLRQNLIGFRRGFQGCGIDYWGLGFDDWLIAVGAQDLAQRMQAALEGAQASVEALNPPLEDAIVTHPQEVAAVHAAVKKLTDLLKTEFVSVLNLELPVGSEGDND